MRILEREEGEFRVIEGWLWELINNQINSMLQYVAKLSAQEIQFSQGSIKNFSVEACEATGGKASEKEKSRPHNYVGFLMLFQ